MNEDKDWRPFPSNPWDEIIPGLWQGGMYYGPSMTPCVPEGDQFNVVISMAGLGPAECRIKDPRLLHHPYHVSDDRLGPGEMALVHEAVSSVTMYIERKLKVLVRCAMGLNRSGLVIALTMVGMGYQPQEAIDMIRDRRDPDALNNPWFVQYIYNYAQFLNGGSDG